MKTDARATLVGRPMFNFSLPELVVLSMLLLIFLGSPVLTGSDEDGRRAVPTTSREGTRYTVSDWARVAVCLVTVTASVVLSVLRK